MIKLVSDYENVSVPVRLNSPWKVRRYINKIIEGETTWKSAFISDKGVMCMIRMCIYLKIMSPTECVFSVSSAK